MGLSDICRHGEQTANPHLATATIPLALTTSSQHLRPTLVTKTVERIEPEANRVDTGRLIASDCPRMPGGRCSFTLLPPFASPHPP